MLDWPIGGSIVISGTTKGESFTEDIVTIVAVSGDGLTVTFTPQLQVAAVCRAVGVATANTRVRVHNARRSFASKYLLLALINFDVRMWLSCARTSMLHALELVV